MLNRRRPNIGRGVARILFVGEGVSNFLAVLILSAALMTYTAIFWDCIGRLIKKLKGNSKVLITEAMLGLC